MEKKAIKYSFGFILIFSIVLSFSYLSSSGSQIEGSYDPIFSTVYGAEEITNPIEYQIDQSELFFNDSYVHEIKLYFDDDDWYDTLYDGHANDLDDPYFEVDFVADGIELETVGINMKGSSSFRGSDMKKSFRLDFNYFDASTNFLGLKKLNLNNGWSDPTLIREKLMYDFASQYISSCRTVFTRVYINDEYYGLYLAVEAIDKTYVQDEFGFDEDGNLFRAEIGATLEYLGEDESLYESIYELKTNNDENNWTSFINFLNVLNTTDLEDLPGEIEKILDVETALTALALLNLFVSLDSYLVLSHNYYMYERDDTGQFTYLLWDCNMAFGTFSMGLDQNENIYELNPFWKSTVETEMPGDDVGVPPGGLLPPDGPPPNRDLSFSSNEEISGTILLDDSESSVDDKFLNVGIESTSSTNRPLIDQLWAIDEYNQTYLQILYDMVTVGGFNEEGISNQVIELSDLIREDYYADPNKEFTISEIELGLTEDIEFGQYTIYGLLPFISNRSSYMKTYIEELAITEGFDLNFSATINTISDDYTSENLPNTVCINEIMASNTLITDSEDSNDTPDWIELYNSGNVSVDLGGMYLVDNLADPVGWLIPEDTIIESNGYLIFWADGSDDRENLHTSFSLSGGGENLALIADDGNIVIDYVDFDAQVPDFSYARVSDGDEEWQQYTIDPTPGYKNIENTTEIDFSEDNSIPYTNIFLSMFSIIGLIVIIKKYEKKMISKKNSLLLEKNELIKGSEG